MNKFEPKQSQPKIDIQPGWAIHVYDKSRRLLFVLDPSHAWLFLLGCGVGLLLSLTWINLAHKSSPVDNAPTQGAPSWQVD